MPCFSTRYHMSFCPHSWSAPDGLPLLLHKQPIWAAGDTPHLMPVEQGLPWPVATGLAGQAIPFIVAASQAHALPSAPFWFPFPPILVASPALLCPSSLFAVLALVPPGVAPAFCVSVLLLPLSVGAPGCPCRAPPPVPPTCPPVRGFHISVRRGLSRARLAVHGPVATPVAGTSRRAGRSSRPCGVRGHLVEGRGGGGVFANGSLGVRRIWWLLQCSHLMVPLCIVLCPVGARLTAVCGVALCVVALLLAFLPISGFFFFCWHAQGESLHCALLLDYVPPEEPPRKTPWKRP